jgi:predicted DNA-binding transcriptional regulator AlpA
MIDVTLRVSGIDLDDARTIDTLGAKFPHLVWQGEGVDLTLSFGVSEANAPAEVLEQVRTLQAAIPGFEAVRTDRDVVSTADIAARVGVSREAARKWGKETDFPTPCGTVSGNMRLWLWTDVLTWLDDSRGIEMDENAPSEALMVQIDNCLMKNPDATSVQWQTVGVKSHASPPAAFGDVVYMAAWSRKSVQTGITADMFSAVVGG